MSFDFNPVPLNVHSTGVDLSLNVSSFLEDMFNQFDALLTQSILTNNVDELSELWKNIVNLILELEKLGTLDKNSLDQFLRLSKKAYVVATTLSNFSAQIQAEVKYEELENAKNLQVAVKSMQLQRTSENRDDGSMISLFPYRSWFLSHFSHPYPSAEDVKKLLELVPSHDVRKLKTWFINARRRSGWQTFVRLYTDGSPSSIRRVFNEAQTFSTNLSPEAGIEIQKVIDWFVKGGRDTISPWLEEVSRHLLRNHCFETVVEEYHDY